MRLSLISDLRNSPGALIATVFGAAALAAVLVAWGAMVTVENRSKAAIDRALMLGGEDWAHVTTNGLRVELSGTAPDERARFRAFALAGGEVDAGRLIDRTDVTPPAAITPPEFSIEMLRNEGGISMIGLVPAATDRASLDARVQKIDPAHPVADLLESADYPAPDRWKEALDFAFDAVALLPRSKISVRAESVAIEAISDSAEQKASWEKALRRNAPGGVRLTLAISAPRPVITPFTLRFTLDEKGARFDACTASTEEGRRKIVAAGADAGVTGTPACTIGLGVPSPDWPAAVTRGIAAVKDLGGGSLTFSDADITLIAAAGTPQEKYDQIIGELEADLPDVFSLHAVLPEPVSASAKDAAAGPPEFVATLSPEGLVQLRGRVADAQERGIVAGYARVRFGVDHVHAAMRLDPNLPVGWTARALAALDALDQLSNGVAVVQPALVDLRGSTGRKNASAEISRILSDKLGEAEDFRVNVKYQPALDPATTAVSPQQCVTAINDTMKASKITFAPGSAQIELSSGKTVDKIAEILKTCPDVAMEIGGYTDSQGREEMNKALSQRRAEAVLSALLARRVLTTNLTAHGYGEENPIADNGTEAGREANRRIEFRLIGTEPAEDGSAEKPGAGDAAAPLRPAERPGTDTGEATVEKPAADAAPDPTEPIVVDPDLKGKRPKPRPDTGGAATE